MRAASSDPSRAVILINRRVLLSYSAAAVVTMARLAGSSAARAADPGALTGPIEQLNAALLAAMKVGQSTPFAQRYAILAPAVERAFDLNAVLRAAVGLSWDNLPRDQKVALAGTFQRYTVSNYAANFDSYSGQIFRVLPETRMLSNEEVVVRTELVRRNDAPIEIDYVMRQTAVGWKAVDVLSGGSISQVAVQRSDFRGLMASGGALALQAGLERKVANLSNGTLATGVGAPRPVRLISTSRGRPRTPDAAASRPQSHQRQIAHSQGHQHRRHASHRGSMPEPAHVNSADAEPLPLHSRGERSG